jgi:putative dehydrogenase
MAAGTASKKTPGKQAATGAARPRVGVIGLGIMGSAMAGNLVKAGFEVFGYDPVAAARATLKRAGGTPCDSATEVARQCRQLVLSLPSVAALEQVAATSSRPRPRAWWRPKPARLPETAKVAARDTLAAAGITLLDCPLSGTGGQARTRDLAVYASGDTKAIQAMGAVFEGFARVRYDVGPFGNGIKMKLVANLLVAIHNQSTAEALALGVRSGLDAAQVVKVVADGAGGSRMLQVRGPMMVDRSWDQATMKVEVWQKDMRLIHEALVATDTAAPLFATCVPIYNAAMALGHAQDDTAAVYSVLEHMMGVSPGKAAGKRPAARKKA